jgi:hypothetical protein
LHGQGPGTPRAPRAPEGFAIDHDFDRDGGLADFAVFRVSTGEWLIFGSSSGFPGPILFGAAGLGDIPLNRPAALR